MVAKRSSGGWANLSSYELTAASDFDAGSYAVVVSNAWGVVTSAVAQVTVVTPPSIVSQPQGQTILVGGNLTLSVAASGTDPLSYQWRKGGAAILTATASTCTIPSVGLTDAGDYAVVVSNAWGVVTSAVAQVTVEIGRAHV